MAMPAIGQDPWGPTILAHVATLMTKGSLVLNVKDYGAIGNGTTDDTAAIQACIDAAETTNSTVHFPAGAYRISTTIRFKKGLRVTCDGMGEVNALSAMSAPATRLEWYGATGGTMVEVKAATLGDNLYGFAYDGPALLGRDLAGYCLYAKSIRYSNINLRAERAQIAGWLNDDSNDHINADNSSDFYFYNSGSNAGSQPSHGFVLWNSTGVHAGNRGCTNFTGGVMVLNTYNGDGIKIGDADACYFAKVHYFLRPGGTGNVLKLCGTAAQADGMVTQNSRACKHVFGYIVGGEIVAEAGSGPNILERVNSESTSVTCEAGAALHYKALDRTHGDVFRTHDYVMDDEYPVPIALGMGTAFRTADGQNVGGLGVPSVRYLNNVSNYWTSTLPCPRHWSKGKVTGVRLVHLGNVAEVDKAVQIEAQFKAFAAGVSIGGGQTTKAATLTLSNTSTTLVTQDIVFDTPATYTRGYMLWLKLTRLGADALDTYTASWDLVSIRLLYTSDGPDSDGADRFGIPAPYLV